MRTFCAVPLALFQSLVTDNSMGKDTIEVPAHFVEHLPDGTSITVLPTNIPLIALRDVSTLALTLRLRWGDCIAGGESEVSRVKPRPLPALQKHWARPFISKNAYWPSIMLLRDNQYKLLGTRYLWLITHCSYGGYLYVTTLATLQYGWLWYSFLLLVGIFFL